ncbi:YopJ/AvrA family T3SS effector serine/threonine acetyltransferase [Bartonella heixiaziensis]|uniref:YopJ/AvrA family T3SS effector serine/threonine acetyltransferase n=1 Tax=Bartonella heixiaziensis TaxID=1461000 RepID=UPI003D20D75E
MKPQDLKNSAQNSSKVQEGDDENKSLESLIAKLQQLNTPQTKNDEISKEQLKDIITDLENDIADGTWVKKLYASTDMKLMPALVEQANLKYPDMHLKFATSPQDFTNSLKETIDAGIPSSRYIVNMKDRGIHFAVVDHQTVDNKPSAIFFEPATLNNMLPAMLALRTQIAVKSEFPECSFSVVEMDIQRSASECGVFSLALAKKLHTEANKLTRLHRDNVNGVLCEPDMPLPPDKLDQYLPATFYKHTQGRRRLDQYMKSNPGAENEKVNKKDETLAERFDKNLVKTEDEKTVSVSSHRKRVREYKSLMM